MSKIWVIGDKVYFNEITALKASSKWANGNFWSKPKVKVFTLESEVSCDDFIKEHDRDIQLRTVLGELTPQEIKKEKIKKNIGNLIVVMGKINFPSYYRINIAEKVNTPSSLLKFINENKVSMLTQSNDVEYYKALIKVTGFKKMSKMKYVSSYDRYHGYTYKYEEQITGLDEIFYKNFEQAKKELKEEL